MFKCAFSHCVPFHLVCNGISDCPDGDDELSCPPDNCPNLFRCSLETTCIDLAFIQDGKLHCPQSQEDELGFQIAKCPKHCHCFGYTLECAGKHLTHIPEYRVSIKILFFRENRLSSLKVFSKGNFYSGLLRIDLSNNSLSTISANSLKRLKKLLFLNFSYNHFMHLQGNIFQSLRSLRVLEIQKNPLRTIASTSLLGLQALTLLNMSNMFLGNIPIGSFMDLKCLVILDLSQNRLYRLENQLFSGLSSLKQLDLKGNKITEVKYDTFLSFPQLDLQTDQSLICCTTNYLKSCQDNYLAQPGGLTNCDNLIPTTALRVLGWFSVLLSMLIGVTSGIFWLRCLLKKQEDVKANPFHVFQFCRSACNMLFSLYLAIIGVEDVVHNNVFHLYQEWWSTSIVCTAARIASSTYVYSWLALSATIAVYQYFATVYPLKPLDIKTNFSIAYAITGMIFLSCLLLNSLLLVLSGVSGDLSFEMDKTCFLMPSTSSVTLVGHVLCLILGTLAISVISSLNGLSAKALVRSNEALKDSGLRKGIKRQGGFRLFISVSNQALVWAFASTKEVMLISQYTLDRVTEISLIYLLFSIAISLNATITIFTTNAFKRCVLGQCCR